MAVITVLFGAGGVGSLITKWWDKKKQDQAGEVRRKRDLRRLEREDESAVVTSWRNLFNEMHDKYEALYKKVEKLQEDHRICEINLVTERIVRQEMETKIAELIGRIGALERQLSDGTSRGY